jgi:cell division protein ZapE
MSQHTITIPPDGSMTPKTWYQAASELPDFVYDAAQAAAIDELDVLWYQLIDFKAKRNQFLGRSLRSPDVPDGLYLWGGVGRGKTFLMDAFYECLPYRRKRSIHFHNFMAEIHHEMKLLDGKGKKIR